VSGEPAVRDELAAQLGKRYGADYTVVAGSTADEVTAVLAESPGTAVALILAGFSKTDPGGIEVVGKVSANYPEALRACAVRWGDLEDRRVDLRRNRFGAARCLGVPAAVGHR
jgi:hypothetical protein